MTTQLPTVNGLEPNPVLAAEARRYMQIRRRLDAYSGARRRLDPWEGWTLDAAQCSLLAHIWARQVTR